MANRKPLSIATLILLSTWGVVRLSCFGTVTAAVADPPKSEPAKANEAVPSNALRSTKTAPTFRPTGAGNSSVSPEKAASPKSSSPSPSEKPLLDKPIGTGVSKTPTVGTGQSDIRSKAEPQLIEQPEFDGMPPAPEESADLTSDSDVSIDLDDTPNSPVPQPQNSDAPKKSDQNPLRLNGPIGSNKLGSEKYAIAPRSVKTVPPAIAPSNAGKAKSDPDDNEDGPSTDCPGDETVELKLSDSGDEPECECQTPRPLQVPADVIEVDEPSASELAKEVVPPGEVEPLAPVEPSKSQSAKPNRQPNVKEKAAQPEFVRKGSSRPAAKPLPTEPIETPKEIDARETQEPIVIAPQMQRLHPRMQLALAYFLKNPEQASKRSPWAMMHAIIPFGVDANVVVENRTVNAIGWMTHNGSCRGQRMFLATKRGGFVPAVGAGLQGHEGQFLAIMAQSHVPSDYPIRVGSKNFTIGDLARHEMATCREKTELTFKLIGLSYYLPNDAEWQNDKGQTWNIEKLIHEELAQPVIGSACGGTHRLMGLSFALQQRRMAGLPIDGEYARAEQFIAEFIDYTWTLQNPDGSFSTNWFESRGNQNDPGRKLQTTGHMLEWLVYTLPDDQLQSPRMMKTIEFVTKLLLDPEASEWKIGPRGHALRALALLDERLFGGEPGKRHRQLAKAASRLQRR